MSYIPEQVKCDECPKTSNGDTVNFKTILLLNSGIVIFETVSIYKNKGEKHACSPECAGKIVTFMLKEMK